MTVQRLCSKTACGRPAVATLTYVYADSMVVLGALATHAEPHSYDLCADHAERLTVPKGWEVVRLVEEFVQPERSDDLVALSDAVHGRRARAEHPTARAGAAGAGTEGAAGTTPGAAAGAQTSDRTRSGGAPERPAAPAGPEVNTVQVGRRAHLRLLPSGDED